MASVNNKKSKLVLLQYDNFVALRCSEKKIVWLYKCSKEVFVVCA
jgi:hypothetical protein